MLHDATIRGGDADGIDAGSRRRRNVEDMSIIAVAVYSDICGQEQGTD